MLPRQQRSFVAGEIKTNVLFVGLPWRLVKVFKLFFCCVFYLFFKHSAFEKPIAAWWIIKHRQDFKAPVILTGYVEGLHSLYQWGFEKKRLADCNDNF